ncbi:MAG: hypothetical protein ACRDRJ_16960, partial [Streptosporangiaceae bacterium]
GLNSADTRGGLLVISRVLVGSADLLTPEVATAVCHAGLPEGIGPQPGTVAEGTVLPPVPATVLTELAEDKTAVLDEAALRCKGLEQVLAAALSDQDTALSVQLPERDITRPPRGNSQAALLWGLRRTVSPVLGRGGRRGWSFSTFEPPLSDMDPGALPDIVFRMAQAAQGAPQAMRKELRVRPQDPLRAHAETLPQHLAKLLVAAYAELGGDELGQRIARAAAGKAALELRITAVYDALDAGTPAVTMVGDRQPLANAPKVTDAATAQPPPPPVAAATPPVPTVPQTSGPQTSGPQTSGPQTSVRPPVPSPYPGLDTGRPFAGPPPAPEPPRTAPEPIPAPEPVLAPEPTLAPESTLAAAPPTPAPPRPARRVRPAHGPQAETTPRPRAAAPPVPAAPVPWAQAEPPPPPRPDVSSARSRHEAPSLFSDHAHHDQAEAPPLPDTLSGLLALLAQGPGHREWEPALRALRATNFRSTADDRALARRRLADHGWYADVMEQQDVVPVHDILVMVFGHAVVPDLRDDGVAAELYSWAAEREAPETVIAALYAAAIGAPRLVERPLGPALAARWRAEHGIHLRSAPRHAAGSVPSRSGTASGERDAGRDAGGRDAGGRDAGGRDAAASQEQPGPDDLVQRLQNLLDRSVTVPVPLVLAILIVLVVVFLATR